MLISSQRMYDRCAFLSLVCWTMQAEFSFQNYMLKTLFFFPIFFLSFYKWICSVSAAEKRILPQQVFYSKKQWLRCSPLPTENYSSCNILQQSDRLSELAYDGLEKCSSFTQKLRAKKFWLIPWVFTYTLILHKYIWIYILHALYIN